MESEEDMPRDLEMSYGLEMPHSVQLEFNKQLEDEKDRIKAEFDQNKAHELLEFQSKIDKLMSGERLEAENFKHQKKIEKLKKDIEAATLKLSESGSTESNPEVALQVQPLRKKDHKSGPGPVFSLSTLAQKIPQRSKDTSASLAVAKKPPSMAESRRQKKLDHTLAESSSNEGDADDAESDVNRLHLISARSAKGKSPALSSAPMSIVACSSRFTSTVSITPAQARATTVKMAPPKMIRSSPDWFNDDNTWDRGF